jgi:AcrR family transcriptional regulator
MAPSAPAHTKATRQDWIDVALDSLADVPIDRLRVLTMAGSLSVSRSSFYWYFKDLDELRSELVEIWRRNTASIVERSGRDAATPVAACLGVFECWADQRLFDARLDLAMRHWGRRRPDVAGQVAHADRERLEAISAMFARYGFDADDSVVRARLLYHSQVGYFALDTNEPIEMRLTYLPYYVEAMTGTRPTGEELADFVDFVVALR